MQFDALEKSVEILQIRVFKNCNKWSPVYKDYWRWKVYKLNKCWYSNRKKSNQGWNTPIYLKNNGLHMKVPLIFTFLIMIFYLCFYHQLWDKWVCMHIGNSSGHIGQTQSRFPKYLWMYDTEWNAHQIDVLDNFKIIKNVNLMSISFSVIHPQIFRESWLSLSNMSRTISNMHTHPFIPQLVIKT